MRHRFLTVVPFALAALVVLSMPLWLEPLMGLPVKTLQPTEVLKLLPTLLLVALLVERALEVFLTTWRGPEANDLDLAVRNATRALAAAKAMNTADPTRAGLLTSATADLTQVEQKRTTYKSTTQTVAMWSGLILGLLVSAVFVRALAALVDTTQPPALQPAGLFRVVDVLVTGGLIAGGSDGIHKLINVYTTFMDATAKRAKGEGTP